MVMDHLDGVMPNGYHPRFPPVLNSYHVFRVFLLHSKSRSKSFETGSDIAIELTKYRAENMNKIVLATLNINSIRNKFSSLEEIVSDNIDVLVIQ